MSNTALNQWAAKSGGSWASYEDRDISGNPVGGWICQLLGGPGLGAWYCHGTDEVDAQQRAVRAIESGEAMSAMRGA